MITLTVIFLGLLGYFVVKKKEEDVEACIGKSAVIASVVTVLISVGVFIGTMTLTREEVNEELTLIDLKEKSFSVKSGDDTLVIEKDFVDNIIPSTTGKSYYKRHYVDYQAPKWSWLVAFVVTSKAYKCRDLYLTPEDWKSYTLINN